MPLDEWDSATIVIPSVAHAIQAGSTLRVSITTPGRDHGTWEFETPVYDDTPTFKLGYGDLHPSKLSMRTLPNIEVPNEFPPCPSLRGQPCRAFVPTPNVSFEWRYLQNSSHYILINIGVSYFEWLSFCPFDLKPELLIQRNRRGIMSHHSQFKSMQRRYLCPFNQSFE